MKPYSQFEDALKRVLAVSKSDLKTKLDAEKQVKKQKQKRPSGHVSRVKD